MVKYTITKNKNEISAFGYDQCFTDEDKNHLWEEHKILYLNGVMAVWIEERTNNNPLVHLMGEDDGHLFWRKETDICFDSHWLNNYIETLSEIKNRLNTK